MTLGLTVMAVLLVVVVVAAITLPIRRSQRRKLETIKERLHTRRAWLAVIERGTHTSVLAVDDNSIQLLTLDGSLERGWPKSDLANVCEAQVQRGAFGRPGLRLEFADQGTSTNSLAVLFTSAGGLVTSAKVRAEVRAALLASGPN